MDIFGNFPKLTGDKKKRVVKPGLEDDFSYADVALDPLGKIEVKTAFGQNFIVKSLIILFFCLLAFRFFWLQAVEGAMNQQLAEGNRIRPRLLEATRGIISDRSGNWLARNKPSFALAVFPSDLPKKKAEREAIYQKIAGISGLAVSDISAQAEKNGLNSLDEILLIEDIPHEEALVLEEKINGISGFFVAKKSIRDYRGVPGLPHLLGYTGIVSEEDMMREDKYYLSDRIGKTGLELQYERALKGTHGIEQIEVDSKGNIVKVLIKEENREPVPGQDLVLNLDYNLQVKAAEALQKGVEEGKKLTGQEVTGGVVGVMDVRSGGILSLISLPDFNNNLFTTRVAPSDYEALAADKSFPMFNRAIKGTYPPGSVSKIILAAAGLEEKAVNLNTALDTPPEIRIGEYTFPDWKDHGFTNIERAIAESNNIFFYALGGGYENIRGIGIERIRRYWELFGLGRETGIDLPGEAAGLLPGPEWKQELRGEPWYIGDTYHVSIGQGDLLVTPIQMLRATAAIANGGKLLKPQLAKKIIDPSGKTVKEFSPVIQGENFISQSNIETVKRGMRMAVTEGSARNLSDLPVSVAGKTGTAQFFNNQKTHAWFTAFAPYENPEIAIIVLVDGGGGGHEIAAPVAKEIINYYFSTK